MTVATITAPHGLKGDVKLDVRTDDPARRFAIGNMLETEPADAGPLTITAARENEGKWVVRFAEADDRNQAEALRGIDLVIESDEEEAEINSWYPHELRGLTVVDQDGTEVGVVDSVTAAPAHDLLHLKEPTGHITQIPFVAALVPEVDIATGTVTIDPPGGLLERDAQDDEAT